MKNDSPFMVYVHLSLCSLRVPFLVVHGSHACLVHAMLLLSCFRTTNYDMW